jgi:hypothetical protein
VYFDVPRVNERDEQNLLYVLHHNPGEIAKTGQAPRTNRRRFIELTVTGLAAAPFAEALGACVSVLAHVGDGLSRARCRGEEIVSTPTKGVFQQNRPGAVTRWIFVISSLADIRDGGAAGMSFWTAD